MKCLILFSLFLSLNVFSFTNDLSLRGGVNLGRNKIEINDDLSEPLLKESSDGVTQYGFHTHLGRKWKKYELLATSYISFGKLEDVSLKANNQIINGDGSIRNVTIAPQLRYHSSFKIRNNWPMYFGVGPAWSLQTVKLTSFQATGSFSNNEKLAYESIGYMLTIGAEENIAFKELHPVYFEFVFVYQRSQKVSTVDASNFQETNILTTEETQQKIQSFSFMISMGLVLF